MCQFDFLDCRISFFGCILCFLFEFVLILSCDFSTRKLFVFNSGVLRLSLEERDPLRPLEISFSSKTAIAWWEVPNLHEKMGVR